MALALISDLDGTIIPNGNSPDYDSLQRLKKYIAERNLNIIYTTGRTLKETQKGIDQHQPPLPQYLITDLGTRIYQNVRGSYVEDLSYQYQVQLHAEGWDISKFQKSLAKLQYLRQQEPAKQAEYKLSYYVPHSQSEHQIAEDVHDILHPVCKDIKTIYHRASSATVAYLDIIPTHACKDAAIGHLCQKLHLNKDQYIYAGNSVSDLESLTSGCRAILVRNASDRIRTRVVDIAESKKIIDRIYFAQGGLMGNGFYASGVLEGLEYFLGQTLLKP